MTQEQAADDNYQGEEKALVSRIAAYVQGQARKLSDMAQPMLRATL